MSIQSEINRIKAAVEDSFYAVSAKGGTVPASTIIENLPDAIASIPSGGAGGAYNIVSEDNGDGTQNLIITDASGAIDINPLNVTENGTYTAPANTAYNPVTVNVPQGAGKAAQIANASGRRNGTSYAAISEVSLTVDKSGVYDVYWSGFRSATSGTFGSQLYVGNTAQGGQQTTFSNHEQHPHLSGVQLSAGDVLTIRGRSGASNNYMYVSNLTIIET